MTVEQVAAALHTSVEVVQHLEGRGLFFRRDSHNEYDPHEIRSLLLSNSFLTECRRARAAIASDQASKDADSKSPSAMRKRAAELIRLAERAELAASNAALLAEAEV